MPTGLTQVILDGGSFADFAWRCARAMTPNIRMRDEAVDVPVRKYEPSTYHIELLREAQKRMGELKAMTVEQAAQAARREYDETLRTYEELAIERKACLAKYEAMLKQVEAWQPPTPDHVAFKGLMRDQINECIERDCRPMEHDVQLRSGEEWLAQAVEWCQRDIDYHSKQNEKEIDDAARANAWNATLAASIPPPWSKP